MSKGTDALKLQRRSREAIEVSPSAIAAGATAYRQCVAERIAPPLVPLQVDAMVERIYRAMRAVG